MPPPTSGAPLFFPPFSKDAFKVGTPEKVSPYFREPGPDWPRTSPGRWSDEPFSGFRCHPRLFMSVSSLWPQVVDARLTCYFLDAFFVTCRDTDADSLLMLTLCSRPSARFLARLLNTSASLLPSSLYLSSRLSSNTGNSVTNAPFPSNLHQEGKDGLILQT